MKWTRARGVAVGVALGLSLAQLSCGEGAACDPLAEASCGLGTACDTATRRCVSAPRCARDADCPARYRCDVELAPDAGRRCFVNCATLGARSDLFCQAGAVCSERGQCGAIAPCVPNGDSAECRGGQCDALTRSCVAPAGCRTSADCDGGFGCSNRECYASCATSAHCAVGRSCDGDAGLCR